MRKMILNNRTPQFIGRVRMASDPTMKIRGGGNSEEWAHHSGAKPSMRMTASWFRSRTGSTEYKVVT